MEWRGPVTRGGLYDPQFQHVVKFLSCHSETFRSQATGTGRDRWARGFDMVRDVVFDGGLGCAGLCYGWKFGKDGVEDGCRFLWKIRWTQGFCLACNPLHTQKSKAIGKLVMLHVNE